jgi:hypothetical protein
MPESDADIFVCNVYGKQCAICGTTEKPFREDWRPTGRNNFMQAWPYCESCWTACQSNGHKPDPEVWTVFLQRVYNPAFRDVHVKHLCQRGSRMGRSKRKARDQDISSKTCLPA